MGFLFMLMGVLFSASVSAANPFSVNAILAVFAVTCFLCAVFFEVYKPKPSVEDDWDE